jgi:hypothetical protein
MLNGKIRDVAANTIVTTIVAGILSFLLLVATWAWSGISDSVVRRAAQLVIDRLEFDVTKSDKTPQEVKGFGCKDKARLIAASCIGYNPSPQAAVGPKFNDNGTFDCYRYGNVSMEVQATAVCMRVK